MLIPNKIFLFCAKKDCISPQIKDYNVYQYNIEDCRQYLLKHFGQNYLNAFDVLYVESFKCDFWKYAVLYNEGGIFMNKNVPTTFLDYIKPTDSFVGIVDNNNLVNCGISLDFIACTPKNPIIKLALDISFNNIVIRRKDFIDNSGITGSVVLCQAVNLYLNKSNTFEKMVVSEDNGIRLINNTKTKAKIESSLESYIEPYKDDPKMKSYKIILWSIFVVGITSLIFAFKYRNKWKVCEKSCLSKSS